MSTNKINYTVYTYIKTVQNSRTVWKCSCGFDYVLINGYIDNYESSDHGKMILPTGKCMKCKKNIKAEVCNGEKSDN